MTARLALALAELAGCTITPADAAPTQTAPVSGLPAAAVATLPATCAIYIAHQAVREPCGYSLGHRNRHQCDCVCVRPAGHDGPHQCSAEAVRP